MSKKDYYEVLGVMRGDTDEKIKKAYKKLAMKHHPDRNQDDPKAEERFKEVKEAYEVLSDAHKRAAYDQHGHAAFESGRHHHESDFYRGFESFAQRFGFGGPSQQRGADIRHVVEVTLEQAASGAEIQIEVPTMDKCVVCKGFGCEPGTSPTTCSTCNGEGMITRQHMHFLIQQPCPTCNGAGSHISSPCKNCHGRGYNRKNKKVDVKIPAGIDNDNNLRMPGLGDPGISGTPPGDLYVIIRVKQHDIFKRIGEDLHCEVPISFTIAALGGEIEVPTLDGKSRINIPAETQTGKQFRLKGIGMPNIHGHGKGDLYCHVKIKTPTNLSDEQIELLKKMKL